MNEKIYDCVVIGGGPAGISAAVYAARGAKKVAVVHNGASALHKTDRIGNYYGFGEVSGKELYERGIAQALSCGAEVISAQVTSVEFSDGGFTVHTPASDYAAKTVTIAVGAARASADIKGLKAAEGKGVSYCAVCDGFFYRKKRVGVIGEGEYAEHEYNALKNIVGDICLFTNGKTPSFAAQKTYTQKVSEVVRLDGGALGVVLDDGVTVETDGLFVAMGVLSGFGLCKSLGVLTDERGGIIVDGRGMTNIAGLFAAGDCTVGLKQIAKAVADGMNVGLGVISYLNADGGE